jgi:PTS system nitrogen regulatory IIA component
MGFFDKFKSKSSTAQAAASADSRLPKVSDYLTPQTIFFFPAGPSKQQVFGKLLAAFELPDPGAAMKSILAREEAGSTVITPGIALPHARIQGITGIKAALGICPSGMHYAQTESEPVKLVLLFLGPADNMRHHLAFLASVSALFQKDGLVESLTHMNQPKAVLVKLRETEKAL